MSAVDLRRACAVTIVEDIHADDVAPGSIEVLGSASDAGGYGYACAGCGARSFLAIGAENSQPRWIVTGGDFARPEGVTLSPSIFHTTERGGCGWHGYLRAGRFEPC